MHLLTICQCEIASKMDIRVRTTTDMFTWTREHQAIQVCVSHSRRLLTARQPYTFQRSVPDHGAYSIQQPLQLRSRATDWPCRVQVLYPLSTCSFKPLSSAFFPPWLLLALSMRNQDAF